MTGNIWAGSGMSASVRGSMNSYRLDRSERLAVAAKQYGRTQLSSTLPIYSGPSRHGINTMETS